MGGWVPLCLAHFLNGLSMAKLTNHEQESALLDFFAGSLLLTGGTNLIKQLYFYFFIALEINTLQIATHHFSLELQYCSFSCCNRLLEASFLFFQNQSFILLLQF